MARSITEIQTQITAAYVSNMAAIGVVVVPSSWSATSLERIIIYVVAFCIYTLELFFDTHRQETLEDLANLKPHSLRWYAQKALAYQHGFDLLPDSDQFDNTGKTEEEIAASKIVKYAAVVEQLDSFGRVILRIKLATDNGNDLEPLTLVQLDGVKEYFKRIKDAGVRLQIDSLPADKLTMKWRVYVDPLVLNGQGQRTDGTDSEPVQTAIKEYLKNLPFNGTFVLSYTADAVQLVDGVVDYSIDECTATYGAIAPAAVDVMYEPDSGYLRFYNEPDLQIEFIPRSPIR